MNSTTKERPWWWEPDKAIFMLCMWGVIVGLLCWLFYPHDGWWIPMPVGLVGCTLAYMMPDMDIG